MKKNLLLSNLYFISLVKKILFLKYNKNTIKSNYNIFIYFLN